MSRIKHTKNELKAQREALRRFQRFLPMLQLKKQQLQMEIQQTDARIAAKQAEEQAVRERVQVWVKLFSEAAELNDLVRLGSVAVEEGNIAGVPIPVLKDLTLERRPYSLFDTPPWFDDAAEVAGSLIRLRVEKDILQRQRDRIADELRVTTQRVNLFEKVKIPECRENIRVIRIFLGDEQTAGVARGKIAKRRSAA